MTKKHYIEIAGIIKHQRAFGEHQETCDAIAKDLCAVFKRENSLFKKDVFLKACGVEK